MEKFLFFVLINLIFLSLPAKAQQKQNAWWLFGYGVGINFNSGYPLADTTNNIFNDQGGAATMSDSDGNLLFHTNGMQVFDRNFKVMPGGHNLSPLIETRWFRYNNITIVKQPGKEHIYYIFTSVQQEWFSFPSYTSSYTVVDMSLNNGLGDVVNGSVNVIMDTTAASVVTPMLHANDNDIWIITHSPQGNTFNSRLLTSSGITDVPIVSHSGFYSYQLYNLVASPNSSKLCLITRGYNQPTEGSVVPQLFDFDRTTGVVYNPIELEDNVPLSDKYSYWGCSFSPDNSKLYISRLTFNYAGSGGIIQFNIDAGTPVAIKDSGILIMPELSSSYIYDIQIGLDGKIYLLADGRSNYLNYYYLHSIDCPNELGLACNPKLNSVSTNGKRGEYRLANQNQFIKRNSNLFQVQATQTTICQGDSVKLAAFGAGTDTFLWTTSEGGFSSSVSNPWVRPTQTTTYTVTGTGKCSSYTSSITIEVKPPFGNPLSTVNICSGDTINIGNEELADYTYQWLTTTGLLNDAEQAQNTITLENYNPTPDTLLYLRRANYNLCSVNDTIVIVVWPQPLGLTIEGNAVVCPGTTANYFARGVNGYQLNWTAEGGTVINQTDSTVEINWGVSNPFAAVWVTATNSYGCSNRFTFPVKINTILEPEIEPNNLSAACFLEAQQLRYTVKYPIRSSHYQWQVQGGNILSGQGTSAVEVKWHTPGEHSIWVSQSDTTILDTCYGTSQVYTVLVHPSPAQNLKIVGPVASCQGTATYSYPGSENSLYRWSVTGGSIVSTQEGNSISIQWNEAGNYQVSVQEMYIDPACLGPLKTLPVTVHALPQTQVAAYATDICPENLNKNYQVTGLAGSSYQWNISGGTITQGQGTPVINVSWFQEANPKHLRVTETTAQGCMGETRAFVLRYDPMELVIETVSVEEELNQLRVSYLVNNPVHHRPDLYLEKHHPLQGWARISSAEMQGPYLDHADETSEYSFGYRLRGTNACGTLLESTSHKTILLQIGNKEDRKASLVWNEYEGWNTPIVYQVWLYLNNEPRPALVEQTSSTSTEIQAYRGFEQCYRIKAITNGKQSWSNSVCMEFENAISIPNVITPNGDGLNETLVIDNLELYPNSLFTVYNRLGQEVYSTTYYKNEWNAAGLPSGIYYYQFCTSVKPQVFKGWVQVIR